MISPYVSFIISSRNDEYILNQEEIVLNSLEDLIESIEKKNFFAEIIFVEWNPPARRAKYRDILIKLKFSHFISFKLISVAPKYHLNLYLSNSIHLCGERAANIGIRMASGKFVINKSQDTYYSKLFYETLSRRDLQSEKINLIERFIIDSNLIKTEKDNRKYTINVNVKRKKKNLLIPYSLRSMGDSLILEKKYWNMFKGFRETKYAITHGIDGELFCLANNYGLDVNILDDKKNYILKPFHEKMFQHATKRQLSKSNFMLKLFNYLKNDKIFRGKILIGRNSIFFLKIFFMKIFKFNYLLKSNNWGLKDANLSNKEILKNKIEYFEIN